MVSLGKPAPIGEQRAVYCIQRAPGEPKAPGLTGAVTTPEKPIWAHFGPFWAVLGPSRGPLRPPRAQKRVERPHFFSDSAPNGGGLSSLHILLRPYATQVPTPRFAPTKWPTDPVPPVPVSTLGALDLALVRCRCSVISASRANLGAMRQKTRLAPVSARKRPPTWSPRPPVKPAMGPAGAPAESGQNGGRNAYVVAGFW